MLLFWFWCPDKNLEFPWHENVLSSLPLNTDITKFKYIDFSMVYVDKTSCLQKVAFSLKEEANNYFIALFFFLVVLNVCLSTSPKGLPVPVLLDVDSVSNFEISRSADLVGRKIKLNQTKPISNFSEY